MGYTIDLSYDLFSRYNILGIKSEIIELALKNQCETYYEDYEMTGNVKQERHHGVMTINFGEDDHDNCSHFISQIKQRKYIFLESVYENSNKGKLLYASSHYLKNMGKSEALDYEKNFLNREKCFSEAELAITKHFRSKKKRSSTI
tara:strand:- start:111 stop:548 length:438 start_codon:yes stop_codon:yes gene_type:complete